MQDKLMHNTSSKTYNLVKDIIGKQLAGGTYSVKVFSKLLGLDNPKLLFKIKSLAWVNDHLEIAIETDKKKEDIFLFEKLQSVKAVFINTKHLTIRCRSKELTPGLSEILLNKFTQKWYNLTLEKLADLIIKDPDLGKPGLPTPAHVDTFRESRSLLDTWGVESSYADFFARGELERAQLDSVEVFNSCISIQHSDLECNNVMMGDKWPIMQLVNFPWENRIRKIGLLDAELDFYAKKDEEDNSNQPKEEEMGGLTTDLSERDVIMGSNEKVRKVLDYVLSRNPQKMILFSNTCVPTVTGEDVESVVKQYQKKFSVPLVYLTVTAQSMNNVLKNLLVNRRLKAEQITTKSNPFSINLIGFQKDHSLTELINILNKLNININTTLLPVLNYEDIDKFPQAKLNVFLPNNLWKHLYDQLLFASKIKYISPEAPYGMSKTKNWFEIIISTLKLNIDLELIWRKYYSEVEDEWIKLTKEAENYRLGFVLRDDELHYVLDSANTWGIPLIAVIEEMGFGIDIAILLRDKNSAEDMYAHIKNLFKYADKHKFFTFNDFGSMCEVLLESQCNAIFTNHFFDWRVTESGKGQFSLQHFEKGITGSINTVKRLLQICKTPFYKKYFKYLQRTPVGLP